MRCVMRSSSRETLAAAANIFMGQTEAPLVIKPYLAKMTRSELLCLMVGGMATIAGGVLAAYVSLGVSAGHLLTASVMSAPAAMILRGPICAPSRMMAPMPTSTLSPTVQACTTARRPTVTRSSSTQSKS